ncbi:hypothetical protein FSP39_011119 [Pinctada imbricata]|uniref:Carbohydrate sulfotransferase n=1 Tax=Pinctada imbricata TaxID=66713 RepID=A0AA88YM85_PINIB|nr:hypothetical protein FSP39_011119 [Pinctada imbricata]
MTGRDRHFYPMFDHCNPCKIKYNFVGRMESFKNDVMCLLDRWDDKYGSNITFSDFEKENDVRMAHSQISRLFGMRDGIEKCITLHEALRRVWKVLQIRGIIPILSNFTFTVEDSVQMKQQDWKNVLTNVIENIPNRQSVKSQRSEALAEAFNLVDPSDIQTYTETYDNDFSLLGYDKTPPSLKHTRKDRP